MSDAGLQAVIAMLAPGGVLIKDDMTPGRPIAGDPVREASLCDERPAGVEVLTTSETVALVGARGWPQPAHNLVHDVAALNGIELLLWEDWGASLTEDVLASGVAEVLDRSAAAVADPGVALAVVRASARHDLLRVPETVLQIDPVSIDLSDVDVTRALAGA